MVSAVLMPLSYRMVCRFAGHSIDVAYVRQLSGQAIDFLCLCLWCQQLICRADFSVNRSTGLFGRGRFRDQEAGRGVAGRDLVERRRLLAAAVERIGAAGMEGASRWGSDR